MTTPSPTSLAGKVALVTGSSQGIGAEIALELARRGADIVINYNSNATYAQEVISSIEALGRKAIAIQANITHPQEITSLFDRALEEFSHLDIVVSNAGKEHFNHISQITSEEFDEIFGLNTKAQLFVAKEAYRCVSEGGRLVLMSSISVQAKGLKGHAIYAGSKAAVESFARQLVNDFADKKITVNAVAPGGTKSAMFDDAVRNYIPDGRADNLSIEEVEKMYGDTMPLKRVGNPLDVAYVVAFLCSEEGRWMNGQTLTIGGGGGP